MNHHSMCGLHGTVLQILKDSSTNSNISNNKTFLHFFAFFYHSTENFENIHTKKINKK